MKTIRVGGLQLGAADNQMDNNVQKILGYIEKAEKLGIHILCMPELSITNYFPKDWYSDLNQYVLSDKDPILRQIIASTEDLKITVIFPYGEKTGAGIFNSAILINQGQVLGKYRKIHLPVLKEDSQFNNFEERYFAPGDLGFPVFQVDGVKIGIQICFDRHFPEGFRVLAVKGARIIFLPSNSASFGPDSYRLEMWERINQVRAYENEVYLVAINKAGRENGWEFLGNSMIVAPDGRIIKRLNHEEEGIFYTGIPLADLGKPGKYLGKRSPGDYKEIAANG
ncbi:MAG TPA: carbon-nitrogen hydrolase family protein [Clostridia bacterium]|nr:carbon-nitrogen hydrolase family protein [Clostridia bacterium]